MKEHSVCFQKIFPEKQSDMSKLQAINAQKQSLKYQAVSYSRRKRLGYLRNPRSLKEGTET